MTDTPQHDDPTLDDLIDSEDDGLPSADHTQHAKAPAHPDDDALEAATERERADAGVTDFAEADVPGATDPLPPGSSSEADIAERGLADDDA